MTLLKQIISAVTTTVRTHRAPRVYAEPIRALANKVIALTALVGTASVIAVGQINLVPAHYQDRVRAVISGATAVAIAVGKVASEVARSKVFSPKTHDAAIVATINSVPVPPLVPVQGP